MDLTAIKPNLVVHAHSLETMPVPDDVHVGRVEAVDGDFLKLAMGTTEDAKFHWIPLSWIAEVKDSGVFLNKNVEEYLWGRLDEKPSSSSPASSLSH